MRSRLTITALALLAGMAAAPVQVLAQSSDGTNSSVSKVLASSGAGFNVAAVRTPVSYTHLTLPTILRV